MFSGPIHSAGYCALTVTDPHAPDQPPERHGIEDIADHAVSFALIESSLRPARHDTTCILATVLQQGKSFADLRRTVHGWVVA